MERGRRSRSFLPEELISAQAFIQVFSLSPTLLHARAADFCSISISVRCVLHKLLTAVNNMFKTRM